MAGLRDRLREELGDAQITGLSYRLATPDQTFSLVDVVAQAQGGVRDRGNTRLLLLVGLDQLDPVVDGHAIELLNQAPVGARLAHEIAFVLSPGLDALSPKE